MSISIKDRKNQSKAGNKVPQAAGLGSAGFAVAIKEALHREYGGNRSAIKAIVAVTHANERTAKNWYAGNNGPSGEFLVLLCRHSDQVLEAVLMLCGRDDLLAAKKLVDASIKLQEIHTLIDQILKGGSNV